MSKASISRQIQRGIVPGDDGGERWMRCRMEIHRMTLSGYTQSPEVMQKTRAPAQAAIRGASHNWSDFSGTVYNPVSYTHLTLPTSDLS